MATGAVVARILTQYSDKGSKAAQKDIAKLGAQFDAFAKKTARAFGFAAAAVGAFALKVGKDAVQAAIADQKSQALLANSLRNTVGATDAAIASVEDYISKLQLQVGVADDELRPSLAKLSAITSDVASAQQLLGVALDISASSGADLGSATQAVTRALQGNFRSLQKLVPSISTASVKGKDFAAILAEIQKATSGAATTRAGTLEFRLNILRIRFGEILETLGYSLLPVIEQFANVIQRDVLPQLEKWINLNKDKLADGLKTASELVLDLLKGAIAFGKWFVANSATIKNFTILIASIWATSKVYAFVKAIGAVSLAFQTMAKQATLAGAASAIATTGQATAGAKFLAGSRALGIVGLGVSLAALPLIAVKNKGNQIRAQRAQVEAGLAGYKGSPGASDIAGLAGFSSKKKTKTNQGTDLVTLFNNLNKVTAAEKKSAKAKEELTKRQQKYNKLLADMGIKTTEQQDAITQFAIRSNLLKQAAMTGSSLTSVGSPTPMNMATAGFGGNVNVYVQGSVISERDLVDLVTKAQQKNATSGSPIGGNYLGGGAGAAGGGLTKFSSRVI